MKRIIKKGLLSVLTIFMTLGMISLPHGVYALDALSEYTIYPTPQNVTYTGEEIFTMSKDINVVYDNGIDQATKNHTLEVMKIKGMNVTTGTAVVTGKTNILVGINDSTGPVDQYFTEKDSALMSKYDAYELVIKENVIAILGKDTDAAFMGVTTLKHIFNQVKDMDIRLMTIKDYANVKNRGFIEGYYGEPWSNEDREQLMLYGGDYKLNQYIYAPKDDKKHNEQWKALYTDEEMKGIKKAIAAGNQSKCYYVYALHPFMSDVMRFDTPENYQEDLGIIKKKFTQLMDAGVKQFAILADDAGVPGGDYNNYIKLMTDLQNWLKEKKKDYEGLKSDMAFCPSDYYNNASSDEMQGLKSLPEGISVIQTGGEIWGSTNNNFLNTYEKNMDGKHPFMWINWPCNDGTKDSLIMGGMERFLIPGANASKMEGIVLNPMMQAEADKQALFSVADYSWNIWKDQAEVDKCWYDSFNYMDHGTIDDTKASVALRELSKHMKNSNTGIPESTELAPKLNAFRTDFESGKDISEKANELIAEFTKLKDAAVYYQKNPGNTRTRNQLNYWLNCWQDRMDAAINYLNTALAIQSKKDNNTIWSYFADAQASLEKSKTNEYWYINHYEIATIGRQHITPFIESLDKTLSNKVVSIVDPSKQVITYITNRTDTSSADQDKIFDGDPKTEVVYSSPNSIVEGTYIGISYASPIKLNKVIFLTGANGNLGDTFSKAKVQYTKDGENWIDINSTIYTSPSEITLSDLDLSIKGIRMIATEKKENTWLGVRDIIVNPTEEAQIPQYNGTITADKIVIADGSLDNVIDKSPSSFGHFMESVADADMKNYIPVDATLTLKLEGSKQLGKITFVQDKGDYITDAVLEYTNDGTTWTELGTFNKTETIELNVSDSHIFATAIRVRNKTLRLQDDGKSGYWWKVYDFSVTEPIENTVDTTTPINPTIIKTERMIGIWEGKMEYLTDKNESTCVQFQMQDNKTIVGDYIGYDLGRLAYIGEVDISVGKTGSGDKWEKYKLEYSTNGIDWKTYKEYTGVSNGKDTIHENLKGLIGRYIRLTNMEEKGSWLFFSEFRVTESVEVPVEKYIYTNTDYALKTITLNDSTELVYEEPITLNKDQYIGVKMSRIKDLKSLESELTSQPNIIIQTSMNGVEWINVDDLNSVKPARYVRIINNTDNPITFNINKFIIYSNEVTQPYLQESTVAINSLYPDQDTRNNGAGFDNDVATLTTFADYPQKDQYILYNLGQVRNINSIRMYLQDTEKNYIRDAKFYVSEDQTNWTEVMNLGDGKEDASDGGTIAKDSGIYKADNTYPNKFYAETTGLSVKGRYLKIVFTASSQTSFVTFNEIMINGGEYVPVQNDPTFESTVIEKRGYAPQNLFDGDLSTSYIPNTTKAGYIIYNISDNTQLKKINIVQKGTASNAKVYALVDSIKSRSQKEWVQIGSLDQSLNELYNPFYKNVYALKVEWMDNKVPQLSEIVNITDASILPDRTALQAYVDALNIDDSKYTKSSYESFAEELGNTHKILKNNNSTQKNLDDALTNITIAFTGLVEKGDLSLVQTKVAELEALDENDYTQDSYKTLKDSIDAAKVLISSDANEITQVQVTDMLNQLQVAQAGLVSILPIDKAALKDYIDLNKFKELDKSLYLSKEFKEFEKVLKKALALIEPTATPTADECQKAAKDLREARKNLVLKATQGEMNNLSMLINSYDEDKYTPSSWQSFLSILDSAKRKVSENEMSSSNVADLRNEILDAAKALVLRGNHSALENAIKDVESIDKNLYTEGSYKTLERTIKEARDLLKKGNELTQAEIDEMINNLALAKQGLIEIKLPAQVKTDDLSHMNFIVGLGLMSLGVAIFLFQRKKQEKI